MKKQSKPWIKKVKGCCGCKHYRMYFCGVAGIKVKIPPKVFEGREKCSSRRKNKKLLM